MSCSTSEWSGAALSNSSAVGTSSPYIPVAAHRGRAARFAQDLNEPSMPLYPGLNCSSGPRNISYKRNVSARPFNYIIGVDDVAVTLRHFFDFSEF